MRWDIEQIMEDHVAEVLKESTPTVLATARKELTERSAKNYLYVYLTVLKMRVEFQPEHQKDIQALFATVELMEPGYLDQCDALLHAGTGDPARVSYTEIPVRKGGLP